MFIFAGIRKEKLPEGYSHQQDLIDAFRSKHQVIAAAFCSGEGTRLQYIDSQIAESVMLEMITKYDQVVLPVHDSFVVKASYGNILKEVMLKHFDQIVTQRGRVKPSPMWFETTEPKTTHFKRITEDAKEKMTRLDETNEAYSRYWRYRIEWYEEGNTHRSR